MTTPAKMMMWGLDHHRASTEMREKAHLDVEKVAALIRAVAKEDTIISCVPVCTCNRTEIYLDVQPGAPVADALARILRDLDVDPALFTGPAGLRLHGLDAVGHLHRVAAGLESMMLGEPQVVAQLKDSYRQAKSHGDLGAVMMRAFQSAFRAGKCVRTGTTIGAGAVSVAFAAVELSRKFFTRLEDHRALLVGAGETGDLAARHFLQQGIGGLTVVNRSPNKAIALAASLNDGKAERARARPWTELTEAIAEVNVVLTTTGATEPVILPDMISAALQNRRGRPLFILDIAVPRDVHPDVADLESVFVFGLDDLDEIVQSNLAARRRELPRAEDILAKELAHFDEWLSDLDLLPSVDEFRCYLEEIKEKQVSWVRKKESPEVAEAVDRSLQQFIKKVTGRSMASLRDAETQDERLRRMSALRGLFGNNDQKQA